MRTKVNQYCCWKPSRKLPALYTRLKTHGISIHKEVQSILANTHWFDITFSELDVMAENQWMTSFSVNVDQLTCTQRILMSIRKAGPGRSLERWSWRIKDRIKDDLLEGWSRQIKLRCTCKKSLPEGWSPQVNVRSPSKEGFPESCAWHFKIRRASKGGYLER